MEETKKNNENKSEKNENKSLTIGVRELDDKQMESVLPGYENIYKQIESMREYAKECGNKSEIMVNNVFSIFGKRGAGKSSVLKTLRKKIIDDNNNDEDIVLPILIPTIVQENKKDMMGWILGSLESEIEKLRDAELQDKKQRGDYSDNFINCKMNKEEATIYKKYSKVLEKYRYTREDYADILKENYSGLKEYIDRTKRILDPENNLKKSFYTFIDKAIELKEHSREPMLFIFLDDIDLAKSCSRDLLSVCVRYLQHPNIIIFISGDYNMFETEQFLSYVESSNLKELIVSPKEDNYLGKKLIDDNKQLAKDALKKIMPPVYRYKLNVLSPNGRLDFYYGDNSDDTIRKLFEKKFRRLDKDGDKGDCLNVINAYGLILDDMPRGIMNVYYALNNIDDNSILWDMETAKKQHQLIDDQLKNKNKNYVSQFKILLDTIIRSSSVLNKYEKEINMCIQINDEKFTETFFNHERLVAQIQGKNKDNENIDDMIIVLIFAHFIESIVQLVSKNRKIHGQREIWKLLEGKEIKEKKFSIYPKINDIDIIFELYESMLSNDALNIMQTMDNIYLKDYSVKSYFDQLEKIDKMGKDKINVAKIGIEDSEWMEEKYKIIFYHCDPLCLMFNKGINIVKEQLKLNEDISNNKAGKQKHNEKKSFNKNISNEFGINFYKKLFEKEYDEIINGEFSTNIKNYKEKLLSELQAKLSTCNELEFKDIKISTFKDINNLHKPIENYFSKLNMNKKEGQYYSKENYGIIYLAIIYNALSEISNLAEYEFKYFNSFKEWHDKLKSISVYQDWYVKRREISPLTLVLEND